MKRQSYLPDGPRVIASSRPYHLGMATLADRILAVSDMSREEAEHLRSLCSSWQVLADLSFSDLLLYVRLPGDDIFEVAAQLRPFTSQTLYPRDMVGQRVTQPEHPVVERAFREGRIWQQDAPVLVDGVQLRMESVPVRCGDRVVGVVTKEGSPATSRRPGLLEQVYLEAADSVSQMISDGKFPFPDTPPGEWPRVGDGLFVIDEEQKIAWASPNALSSLRRLEVKHDVLGRYFDDLGLSQMPVAMALEMVGLVDEEFVRGGTHVFVRVMPLIENGAPRGALVLSRDVSELREKERLLSVKDATIREIHHRVKNNLQTIASLLRLQGRRLRSEESKAAIEESVLRIVSIALVHETLSEHPSDVAEFGEVARRIGRMVSDGLTLPDRDVRIDVKGEAGSIGADLATPLAVSVTELIQNALEHAFPERAEGHISVGLERSPGQVRITVQDDGVGYKDDVEEGSRLGLQIVRSLIEELRGSFSIRATGSGTEATIRVPIHR
jgi:two-component sensor histidine kinase